MKLLIIGRTCSGKDTLANHLTKKYGLKGVKSFTTRPKRYDDEDTHVFISREQAKEYTDKVATTTINGQEYFATREQVEEADYYIIDPKGANELMNNMSETKFVIIYLRASVEVRKNRSIGRGDSDFLSREISESKMFHEFETKIGVESLLNGKLKNIAVFDNFDDCIDWCDEFLKEWCNMIILEMIERMEQEEVLTPELKDWILDYARRKRLI